MPCGAGELLNNIDTAPHADRRAGRAVGRDAGAGDDGRGALSNAAAEGGTPSFRRAAPRSGGAGRVVRTCNGSGSKINV